MLCLRLFLSLALIFFASKFSTSSISLIDCKLYFGQTLLHFKIIETASCVRWFNFNLNRKPALSDLQFQLPRCHISDVEAQCSKTLKFASKLTIYVAKILVLLWCIKVHRIVPSIFVSTYNHCSQFSRHFHNELSFRHKSGK